VGLFAAALGAQTTLSDMRPPLAATAAVSYSVDGALDHVAGQSSSMLDLLRSNAAANNGMCKHEPTVIELDWTDNGHVELAVAASPLGEGFSLILGSDITHASSSHTSLASAISRMLQRPRIGHTGARHPVAGGIALIAHETRSTSLKDVDPSHESFETAARLVGLRVASMPLTSPIGETIGQLIQLTRII
jgi:hypothetical protein